MGKTDIHWFEVIWANHSESKESSGISDYRIWG